MYAWAQHAPWLPLWSPPYVEEGVLHATATTQSPAGAPLDSWHAAVEACAAAQEGTAAEALCGPRGTVLGTVPYSARLHLVAAAWQLCRAAPWARAIESCLQHWASAAVQAGHADEASVLAELRYACAAHCVPEARCVIMCAAVQRTLGRARSGDGASASARASARASAAGPAPGPAPPAAAGRSAPGGAPRVAAASVPPAVDGRRRLQPPPPRDTGCGREQTGRSHTRQARRQGRKRRRPPTTTPQ